MKLDATPLGKPLYAKLGFVDEYEIERWILKRPPAVSRTARSTCPRLVPVQLEQIFQFDSELFGADRSFLLRSLHDQNPGFAVAVYEKRTATGLCLRASWFVCGSSRTVGGRGPCGCGKAPAGIFGPIAPRDSHRRLLEVQSGVCRIVARLRLCSFSAAHAHGPRPE
jgi:hypothetical protein